MKKNTIKFYMIFSQTLIILFNFFIIYGFFLTRVHAETGFEKFNISLNWLLTGSYKNEAPANMANAELGKILNIVDRVTTKAVDIAGVFAFLVILYSAFMYATAFGEESKAETAKKALTWSIIGMVVIIFFKVIMRLVNNSLQ